MSWYIEIVLNIIEEHCEAFGKENFNRAIVHEQLLMVDQYLSSRFISAFSELPPISTIVIMLALTEKWFAEDRWNKIQLTNDFLDIYAVAFLLASKMDCDNAVWSSDLFDDAAPLNILKDKSQLKRLELGFLSSINYETFVKPNTVTNIINRHSAIDKVKQFLGEADKHGVIIEFEKIIENLKENLSKNKNHKEYSKRKISRYEKEANNELHYRKVKFYSDHISPIKSFFIDFHKKIKSCPSDLVEPIKALKNKSRFVAHDIFEIDICNPAERSATFSKQIEYIEDIKSCQNEIKKYLTNNKPSLGTRILSCFSYFYYNKVNTYKALKEHYLAVEQRFQLIYYEEYYQYIKDYDIRLGQIYRHPCLQKQVADLNRMTNSNKKRLSELKSEAKGLKKNLAKAEYYLTLAKGKQVQALLLSEFEAILSADHLETAGHPRAKCF